MRRVENSAGFLLSLRPVAMTGIVTPLIVSVPLCRGSAAVLNLPGLPKPRHPPPRRARVRQNMSALIRDEYGSQALFLAVTAAVRVRVAKKTTPAERPCNTYRKRAFCVFRLGPFVPRDSVEKLCGKILIHRLNRARVVGQHRRAGQKKFKIAGPQLSPWHRAFSGPAKLCAVSR
jgi:hypothetical protein